MKGLPHPKREVKGDSDQPGELLLAGSGYIRVHCEDLLGTSIWKENGSMDDSDEHGNETGICILALLAPHSLRLHAHVRAVPVNGIVDSCGMRRDLKPSHIIQKT